MGNCLRLIVSILAMLTCVLVTVAEAAVEEPEIEVRVARITGVGIFAGQQVSRQKEYGRDQVAADIVRGVDFLVNTREIPARQGTKFGFQYLLDSTPIGQHISITSIIRFPEPGLKTPDGRIYQQSVEHKRVRIGHPSLHGYGFDEPWEMMTGEWVFEIWHNDVRLIRKTFWVVNDPEESDAVREDAEAASSIR